MSFKLMDKLLLLSNEGILRGIITKTFIYNELLFYIISTDNGVFHVSTQGLLTYAAKECSNE